MRGPSPFVSGFLGGALGGALGPRLLGAARAAGWLAYVGAFVVVGVLFQAWLDLHPFARWLVCVAVAAAGVWLIVGQVRYLHGLVDRARDEDDDDDLEDDPR